MILEKEINFLEKNGLETIFIDNKDCKNGNYTCSEEYYVFNTGFGTKKDPEKAVVIFKTYSSYSSKFSSVILSMFCINRKGVRIPIEYLNILDMYRLLITSINLSKEEIEDISIYSFYTGLFSTGIYITTNIEKYLDRQFIYERILIKRYDIKGKQ